MDNMINVTGIDLIKFTQKVYALSRPLGLGIIHFTPGPLTHDQAQELVNIMHKSTFLALSLDYVFGRACKMNVFKKDGKLEIRDYWGDHSKKQLEELLKHCGIGG